MQLRVGVDIVSVSKVERVVRRWRERFLRRVFSEEELRLSEALLGKRRYQFLAGRFAAKEALIKTLDIPLPYRKIVVSRMDSGRPVVDSPLGQYDVSISHTDEYAVAVCVRY